MNTCNRVEAICRHLSGVGTNFSFHNETTLAGDLDLDSLDLVTLAMKIEDEFGIEISDDDVDSPALGTFGGLVAHVEGKLHSRAARQHENLSGGAIPIVRDDMTGGTAIA